MMPNCFNAPVEAGEAFERAGPLGPSPVRTTGGYRGFEHTPFEGRSYVIEGRSHGRS